MRAAERGLTSAGSLRRAGLQGVRVAARDRARGVLGPGPHLEQACACGGRRAPVHVRQLRRRGRARLGRRHWHPGRARRPSPPPRRAPTPADEAQDFEGRAVFGHNAVPGSSNTGKNGGCPGTLRTEPRTDRRKDTEPTAPAPLLQEEEAEAKAEAERTRPGLTIFTDGSRLDDGATKYSCGSGA